MTVRTSKSTWKAVVKLIFIVMVYISYIGSSHGRQFCVGVISRSNLDNICRNNAKTVKAPEDSTEFASRPPPCLRSASRRCEGGVDGINLVTLYPSAIRLTLSWIRSMPYIDREVYWRASDSLSDFLDDSCGSYTIY